MPRSTRRERDQEYARIARDTVIHATALQNDHAVLADKTDGYLQTMPTALLLALATDETFDVRRAIKRTIASRGLNADAQWVGFDNAKAAWGLTEPKTEDR